MQVLPLRGGQLVLRRIDQLPCARRAVHGARPAQPRLEHRPEHRDVAGIVVLRQLPQRQPDQRVRVRVELLPPWSLVQLLPRDDRGRSRSG